VVLRADCCRRRSARHAYLRRRKLRPDVGRSSFDTLDEVVAKANYTEHGLAAYICATRIDTIFQLVRRLDFAMVSVNGVKFTGAPIPFGGMKASGLGREGGSEGFEPSSKPNIFASAISACR